MVSRRTKILLGDWRWVLIFCVEISQRFGRRTGSTTSCCLQRPQSSPCDHKKVLIFIQPSCCWYSFHCWSHDSTSPQMVNGSDQRDIQIFRWRTTPLPMLLGASSRWLVPSVAGRKFPMQVHWLRWLLCKWICSMLFHAFWIRAQPGRVSIHYLCLL